MTGNRDSLTVTPSALAMARVFAADVVEQIHGELAVPAEDFGAAVAPATGPCTFIPAELRAWHAAVQAKFSASVAESSGGKPVDWAARAVIQDEFAEVCEQVFDAVCGKDSVVAGLAYQARSYWREMAVESRRLAELRAGGAR